MNKILINFNIISVMKKDNFKSLNSNEENKGPYEPLLNNYEEIVPKVRITSHRLIVNRKMIKSKIKTEK